MRSRSIAPRSEDAGLFGDRFVGLRGCDSFTAMVGWLVGLEMLEGSIHSGLFIAAISSITNEFGFSGTEKGIISSSYAAAQTLASVPISVYGRESPQVVMGLGGFLVSACALVFAFGQSLPQFVAGHFGIGIGASAVLVLGPAYIDNSIDVDKSLVAKYTGYLFASLALGVTIGAFVFTPFLNDACEDDGDVLCASSGNASSPASSSSFSGETCFGSVQAIPYVLLAVANLVPSVALLIGRKRYPQHLRKYRSPADQGPAAGVQDGYVLPPARLAAVAAAPRGNPAAEEEANPSPGHGYEPAPEAYSANAAIFRRRLSPPTTPAEAPAEPKSLKVSTLSGEDWVLVQEGGQLWARSLATGATHRVAGVSLARSASLAFVLLCATPGGVAPAWVAGLAPTEVTPAFVETLLALTAATGISPFVDTAPPTPSAARMGHPAPPRSGFDPAADDNDGGSENPIQSSAAGQPDLDDTATVVPHSVAPRDPLHVQLMRLGANPQEEHNQTKSTSGLILGVTIPAMFLGSVLGGWIPKHFGWGVKGLLMVGWSSSALSVISCFAVLSTSFAVFSIFFILALFVVFISAAPLVTAIERVVLEEDRELALAVSNLCSKLFGGIGGPLVFGALID
eukprot:gene5508-8383_t